MAYSTLSYTPSEADVQRYSRLRTSCRELNAKIVKTLPMEALKDIASRLGMWKQNKIFLRHDDELSVLMDACLYDWIHDGTNWVENYAKNHIPAPNTNEYELLRAYRRASYKIVKVDSQIEGAGVYCSDFYSGDELFIMDMGLSVSPVNLTVCTRMIFLKPFWITGGTALIADPNTVQNIAAHLMKRELVQNYAFTDQHEAALTVIQMLLEAGAIANIKYQELPPESGK
jgi:hypothetical protein